MCGGFTSVIQANQSIIYRLPWVQSYLLHSLVSGLKFLFAFEFFSRKSEKLLTGSVNLFLYILITRKSFKVMGIVPRQGKKPKFLIQYYFNLRSLGLCQCTMCIRTVSCLLRSVVYNCSVHSKTSCFVFKCQ